MNFARITAALAGLAAFAAQAQSTLPPNTVPEPEVWALMGVAAVVGALVSKRRK